MSFDRDLSDLKQTLGTCLTRIEISLKDLNEQRTSGCERVHLHCEFMRQDIEISAESKCIEIRDQSDDERLIADILTSKVSLIEDIDAYEDRCLAGIRCERNDDG